jgi:hypothetical protein
MGFHSLNSPSSFARRIGCRGSANMEKDLPNETSPYAAEGTAAHELGERCLGTGRDPEEFEGEMITVEEFGDFEVTPEMINAVKVYVDHCREVMSDNYAIEERLDLSFLGEGQSGTADFVSLDNKILHVIDYKHGKGVPVDVIGNVQGMCYGLGAKKRFDNYDWQTLRITIVQPRAPHADGGVRSWDIPREELFDYMMTYAQIAKETEDPDAPLRVGDWCRFCKAKPMCPQQMKNAEEMMQMDFADETSQPVDIKFLSKEQLADLALNKVKAIELWCKSVKEHAQKVAEAGDPLPGTKLVHTRTSRAWKDPAQAEKFFEQQLGEKVFEKKFMTAPKIEKLVGKKKFAEFGEMVDSFPTGVTLVHESDPRANIRPSVEDEFA